MRRLKLSLILPVSQFLLASVLLRLGHTATKAAGFDTLYVSTPTLICYGLNAPAVVLLKSLLFWLPRQGQPVVLGFDSLELGLLIGIILQWYAVVWIVEQYSFTIGQVSRAQIIVSVIMIATGSLLGYAGAVTLRYQSFNNLVGQTIEIMLVLAWAASLVGLPLAIARRYLMQARVRKLRRSI